MIVEIDSEELDRLKNHSRMLSQISAHVEDFCEDDKSTTLLAVLVLLHKYHTLQGYVAFTALERERERQLKPTNHAHS